MDNSYKKIIFIDKGHSAARANVRDTIRNLLSPANCARQASPLVLQGPTPTSVSLFPEDIPTAIVREWIPSTAVRSPSPPSPATLAHCPYTPTNSVVPHQASSVVPSVPWRCVCVIYNSSAPCWEGSSSPASSACSISSLRRRRVAGLCAEARPK